jgi:hypothetical protein
VDGEIEPGLGVVDPADAADEEVGALPYAAVRTAMAARKEAAKARQAYYDDLTAKLVAQRTGPSFSERMFQLSAALAQPTTRRGIGGVLANVAPVLQAQEQAKREGETKRRDALSALQAAQLSQREDLLGQELDTEVELAKLSKQGTGPGQWSEKYGRFIPKDRPVPIKVGVLNGRRIVTLTDGTSKLYGVGGNPKAYEILDAAGNVIGQETE